MVDGGEETAERETADKAGATVVAVEKATCHFVRLTSGTRWGEGPDC